MVHTRAGIGIAALLLVGTVNLVQAEVVAPAPGIPPVIVDVPFFELSVIEPDVPVPRNGAILIAGSESEVPIIAVTKTDSGTIMIFGGTTTHVSGPYWAWTPTAPLALGPYDVRVASSIGVGSSAVITVIDEMVLEPPPLSSDPVASWVATPHELATCEVWTGVDLVPGISFPVTVKGTAMVLTQLATDAPRELAHQFMFRAIPAEREDSPFAPITLPVVAGPYAEQAEEYCYELEAIDLATLTVQRYDQEFGCAPHGDLPSFDERAADVTDELLSRNNCIMPPAGFEERWCMLNMQCLDLTDPVTLAGSFCQSYRDFCPDRAPMQAGAGGSSVGTGGSGMTGELSGGGGGAAGADTGEPDEPDHDVEPARPEAEKPMHTGGCSVRRAEDSASGLMLLLTFGLLVARAGKRRA